MTQRGVLGVSLLKVIKLTDIVVCVGTHMTRVYGRSQRAGVWVVQLSTQERYMCHLRKRKRKENTEIVKGET